MVCGPHDEVKDVGNDFWWQVHETEHTPVYKRAVELTLEGGPEKSKGDLGTQSPNLSFTERYRFGPRFELLFGLWMQPSRAAGYGFRHGCESVFHDL